MAFKTDILQYPTYPSAAHYPILTILVLCITIFYLLFTNKLNSKQILTPPIFSTRHLFAELDSINLLYAVPAAMSSLGWSAPFLGTGIAILWASKDFLIAFITSLFDFPGLVTA